MTNAQKEHLLHKILAGSAFSFALALLPIANYYFQQPAGSEQGNVAGVSTEKPEILGDVAASPSALSFAQCMTDKQTQLDGLDRLQSSWQVAYAKQISADSSQASIDANTTKYQKEFAAVESERTKIEAENCS